MNISPYLNDSEVAQNNIIHDEEEEPRGLPFFIQRKFSDVCKKHTCKHDREDICF